MVICQSNYKFTYCPSIITENKIINWDLLSSFFFFLYTYSIMKSRKIKTILNYSVILIIGWIVWLLYEREFYFSKIIINVFRLELKKKKIWILCDWQNNISGSFFSIFHNLAFQYKNIFPKNIAHFSDLFINFKSNQLHVHNI